MSGYELSTNLTKCTNTFHDGGFHPVIVDTCRGSRIVIRRESYDGFVTKEEISFSELRVYQAPNIFKERSGFSITGPSASQVSNPLSNLTQNQSNRSGGDNKSPIIDAVGTLASYNSCYKTN